MRRFEFPCVRESMKPAGLACNKWFLTRRAADSARERAEVTESLSCQLGIAQRTVRQNGTLSHPGAGTSPTRDRSSSKVSCARPLDQKACAPASGFNRDDEHGSGQSF